MPHLKYHRIAESQDTENVLVGVKRGRQQYDVGQSSHYHPVVGGQPAENHGIDVNHGCCLVITGYDYSLFIKKFERLCKCAWR